MISQAHLEMIAKVYEGILILGSLPNSPAQHSGLKYGDILIMANGMRTKTIADFFAARAMDQERLDLVLVRDGVEFEISIGLTRRRVSVDELRRYFHPEGPDATNPGVPLS